MVNSPRSAIIAAVIWLTAVATVSATAWVAIDRAGRDITNADVSALSTALTTPTRASEPMPTASTPSASATPKPSATPTPSAPPTPSATPRHTTPTAVTDRTINVDGGQVSVRCTGTVITLQSAQPENEWRVHVETSTTQVIEVAFRKGDEEDGTRTTRVTALCTNGTPSFKVSNS